MTRSAKNRKLPLPTPSEAAFERLLENFDAPPPDTKHTTHKADALDAAPADSAGSTESIDDFVERMFAQHLAAQPAPSTRMLYEKILRGEAG